MFARNYAKGPCWISGKIVGTAGNVLRLVRTSRGIWKRHQDLLKYYYANADLPDGRDSDDDLEDYEPVQEDEPVAREQPPAPPLRGSTISTRGQPPKRLVVGE